MAAVEEKLLRRDMVLKDLHQNIRSAQARMKRNYESNHTEREFSVGDWVYLKLQPYKQLSMRKYFKLSPKYYGPFKVLQRIRVVAYKLELPGDARIHLLFHVSFLKKVVGHNINAQSQLPVVINEKMVLVPLAVLEYRRRKGKGEVLVHWQGLSPSDAT